MSVCPYAESTTLTLHAWRTSFPGWVRTPLVHLGTRWRSTEVTTGVAPSLITPTTHRTRNNNDGVHQPSPLHLSSLKSSITARYEKNVTWMFSIFDASRFSRANQCAALAVSLCLKRGRRLFDISPSWAARFVRPWIGKLIPRDAPSVCPDLRGLLPSSRPTPGGPDTLTSAIGDVLLKPAPLDWIIVPHLRHCSTGTLCRDSSFCCFISPPT